MDRRPDGFPPYRSRSSMASWRPPGASRVVRGSSNREDHDEADQKARDLVCRLALGTITGSPGRAEPGQLQPGDGPPAPQPAAAQLADVPREIQLLGLLPTL